MVTVASARIKFASEAGLSQLFPLAIQSQLSGHFMERWVRS